MLASPWSPSTIIRSATQTMGGSHPQRPVIFGRNTIGPGGIFSPDYFSPDYLAKPAIPGLVPGASPPGQAPVHSVSTSEVANSEQLSSLNIPQATPPPPAVVTLTTSNNNAASPTNLPGNTASLPAAEPARPTASESAVNPNNVAPVGFSQASAVLRQPKTHPPESLNDIPDPTNLNPAPDETQPPPTSRGATSPAPAAAREDETSVGMPRTPQTIPSPTSEHAFAVSGTDQPSMPPTIIPTTAPAILTVLGSAHNAYPASQRIWGGRILNSSATARGSAGISSVIFMGNGTSAQKPSTVADTTANVKALSRQPVTVSSTSLFSVGTTATSPATISSSSNAVGLQFKGAGSQLRDLEMIWLLGCLTLCMMVGARILA